MPARQRRRSRGSRYFARRGVGRHRGFGGILSVVFSWVLKLETELSRVPDGAEERAMLGQVKRSRVAGNDEPATGGGADEAGEAALQVVAGEIDERLGG